MRPGLLMGIVSVVSLLCLVAAVLLTINSGVFKTMAGFLSETSEENSTASDQPESSTVDNTAPFVSYTAPNQMKGVWLVAGTDYLNGQADTGEDVRAQIDAAFASVSEWQFNTVIVPLQMNGQLLSTQRIVNKDGSAFDPLSYILESADKNNAFAYGVVDLGIGSHASYDPSTITGASAIHELVAQAVSGYAFDGYLLDNVGYVPNVTAGSYAAYMEQAPGAGFEEYLRGSVSAAVYDAVRTIKNEDINLYVGLMASPVWAHESNNANGSQTSGVYQSLTDGYADTRAWIQDGLFDFVMVRNEYSTKDQNAPFDKVLSWWDALCAPQNTPLYMCHAANKVSGKEKGWNSPDQLAHQVLACKKVSTWKGSAFYTVSALKNDTEGSTGAMLGAWGGDLSEEYISRTLTFSSPQKTDYTTYESKVNIRGSADPNFPLTMNGDKVALTDHGFFSIDLSLSIGKNTFTFKHKGETVTYTITYSVVIIQSVEPSSELALEGGTEISITAIGRKGATLYAKINGQKIAMKEAPIQSDENDKPDENSDYVNFSGTYTLPAGKIGQKMNLGAVTVYGSYQGLSESKKGGTIVVNALPTPPPTTTTTTVTTTTTTTMPPTSSTPGSTDSSAVSKSPIPGGGGSSVLSTGKVVTINRDYSETFWGTTTDDYSRPTNAYLPFGTADVVVKTVYDSASKNYYYLLGSGQRVYRSEVKDYSDNGTLTSNTLKAMPSSSSESTVITLDATWRIPYTVKLLPQKYGNEATQNYNISAFTAEYIEFTFFYTTEVSGTPDVSSSALFSSALWSKNNNNSYTLRLNLKKTGGFYGYSVHWTDNQQLVLTFNNPTGVQAGDKPLSGKRIVLDPGHGGTSIGTAGGNVAEKTLTLIYAQKLKAKLEGLGATVVLTRTDDTLPDLTVTPNSMSARTAFARNNGTDLFLSIHMDGATSASARGYTVYYFNEYSQPFAQAITNRVEPIYKSFSGTAGRKYKWGAYFVARLHDCPSLLVECGFMSNTNDLELLISSSYQDGFTQGMADGIVDYFKSIS